MTRGSLSVDDARRQASALLDYLSRGGDARRWWTSKDFSPEDRAAIRQALQQLRSRR